MYLKSKLKTLLILLMFNAFFSIAQAQGGPGDPGDDPGGPGDATVPLDGGLSLLIAAGIGYAAKKGYDKRKKTKTDNTGQSEI